MTDSPRVPMPFIVGSPRSGTTLLRLMLDAHSALAIPPETGFLRSAALSRLDSRLGPKEFLNILTTFPENAPAWQDFGLPAGELGRALEKAVPFTVASGIRCFYSCYAARQGKARYGDKTPMYAHSIASISALLPEAVFIHIIRDGRDASLSLRDMWFAPGRDIRALAAHWRQNVVACREQARHCGSYLELRFEDLLRDTEGQLRRICRFIDLEFEPRMLRYHERAPARLTEHRERRTAAGDIMVSQEQRYRMQWRTTQPPDLSRAGSWRASLTAEEHAIFLETAGDLLVELGYDPRFA